MGLSDSTPRDQVHGALVPSGGTKDQQEQVLPKILPQKHLHLAQEVRRDKQPVLDTLGGAKQVCHDA